MQETVSLDEGQRWKEREMTGRKREREEAWGGIGLHNGIVRHNDKREEQIQSRVRFLKERTVNTEVHTRPVCALRIVVPLRC